MSVSSASAAAASTVPSILRPHGGCRSEVLRRSRHAPRSDDRVLRPSLLRAAALRGAGAPRPRRPAERELVLRARALEDVSQHLGELDPQRGRGDPCECHGARDRRRRLPALVVARLLQRAGERLQHRLRPAEPRVPARQGAGDDDDDRLAGLAVRVARDRVGRAGGAEALRGLPGQRPDGAGDRDLRLGRRAVRLPHVGVLRADERGPEPARGASRLDHRRGAPRSDLPGAAAVRPALEAQPGAADPLRPGRAARVAVRDGERDRPRRRGELVARQPAQGRPRRLSRGKSPGRHVRLGEPRCQAPGFELRKPVPSPGKRLGLRLRRGSCASGQLSAASTAAAARARCEFARFQSSPSSATVRSSPAGTKTGS